MLLPARPTGVALARRSLLRRRSASRSGAALPVCRALALACSVGVVANAARRATTPTTASRRSSRLLFIAYTVGRHLEGRRAAGRVADRGRRPELIVASPPTPTATTPTNFIVSSIVSSSSAPMLLGRLLRHRVRLNRALREKARAARARAPRRARTRPRVEERTRIAGELHDVVAHALSAMVVQAAGARAGWPSATRTRARERVPGRRARRGREALTEIRGAARRAAPRGRGAGARAAAVPARTSRRSSQRVGGRACRSSCEVEGDGARRCRPAST